MGIFLQLYHRAMPPYSVPNLDRYESLPFFGPYGDDHFMFGCSDSLAETPYKALTLLIAVTIIGVTAQGEALQFDSQEQLKPPQDHK